MSVDDMPQKVDFGFVERKLVSVWCEASFLDLTWD